MDKQAKFRATIIEKYGSWENYVRQRYNNPEKAEARKRAASIAGKAGTGEKKRRGDSEYYRKLRNGKNPEV